MSSDGRRLRALDGEMTAAESITAITLSCYPRATFANRPRASLVVSQAIGRYLTSRLTFVDLVETVRSVTDILNPLEQLQKIVHMDPAPPPTRPEHRRTRVTRKEPRLWENIEDQRLLAGILRIGIGNWMAISRFVGNGRTRSQCSQRWYRILDPRISRDPWTREEEHKLLELVRGKTKVSWTRLAVQMGNRNDLQCYCRYQKLHNAGHAGRDEGCGPSGVWTRDTARLAPFSMPFAAPPGYVPVVPPPEQQITHDTVAITMQQCRMDIPAFDASMYSVA